ncbi:MAG TPA: phosphoribosyltransferase family protein [Thermoanaerobaculia bacterium]
MNRFRDRLEAGRRLAVVLAAYAPEHPLVLGLPRGGVAVAAEVARALQAPLDVWVVRKIGVPWQPELGVGAVSEGGLVYVDRATLRRIGLTEADLAPVIARQRAEVEERVARFRRGRPRPDLRGRTVILVDDGVATGGTVRSAIRAVRAEAPKRIVLAVPVAAAQTVDELADEADRVVCLLRPDDLFAVGAWYQEFEQVEDAEVVRLLDLSRAVAAPSPAARPTEALAGR